MSTRTPYVDRRIIEHLIQAARGPLPEDVVKAHLGKAELSHFYLWELLQRDPAQINRALFMHAIGQLNPGIKSFADRNILDRVVALGGPFADANMTVVFGGETPPEQRRRKIIGFRGDNPFKLRFEGQALVFTQSIASEVIYLADILPHSRGCTYDQVENKISVEGLLAALPSVKGLKWVVGNMATINRILADHLKVTGKRLLESSLTWTTDTYVNPYVDGLFPYIVVGLFKEEGADMGALQPKKSDDRTGLFVLGVPADEA